MKNQMRKKFDIKKFSMIILFGLGILLIIAGLTIDSGPVKYTVTCEFKPVYNNYTETLKFVYKDDKMYEYHQTETLKEADDVGKSLDELYDFYVDRGSEYITDDDFKYEVTKKKDHVESYTFLNVNKYPNQFDSYATNLYISHDLTSKELKKALEATNYNCQIESSEW